MAWSLRLLRDFFFCCLDCRNFTQTNVKMTPAQLDHLSRIKCHLETLLATAEKRTPGEWDHGYGNSLVVHKKTDYTIANTSSGEVVAEDCPIIPWQEQVANSEYIAACAGNAEAGWKSTLGVIKEALFLTSDARQEMSAILKIILAAWPIEKLP